MYSWVNSAWFPVFPLARTVVTGRAPWSPRGVPEHEMLFAETGRPSGRAGCTASPRAVGWMTAPAGQHSGLVSSRSSAGCHQLSSAARSVTSQGFAVWRWPCTLRGLSWVKGPVCLAVSLSAGWLPTQLSLIAPGFTSPPPSVPGQLDWDQTPSPGCLSAGSGVPAGGALLPTVGGEKWVPPMAWVSCWE